MPKLTKTFEQISKEKKSAFEYGYNGFILCYSETGKIDIIIKDLEQHLLLEPDSVGLLSSLANCYFKKGDYDKVFEIIDKALSIDPYDYDSLSILAKNYYKKESYNRAIYYFKEAIRISYNQHSSLRELGLTYVKIKDFDQAIRIFQFILSIWSKEGLDYFILAKIYEHLGKIDIASEYFEKASIFKSYIFQNYDEYILAKGVFNG